MIETADLYNTAGVNDDPRAFCSIPARQDVWRCASANWLAGLVMRQIVTEAEAHEHKRTNGMRSRLEVALRGGRTKRNGLRIGVVAEGPLFSLGRCRFYLGEIAHDSRRTIKHEATIWDFTLGVSF